MTKIIVGIDEAGRGPVIGPLVICVYAIEADKTKTLEENSIKDSKKLTKKKRDNVYSWLCKQAKEYKTHHITATAIDEMRKNHSLNVIEQRLMLKLLKTLSIMPDEIYIDAADVNEERFGQLFAESFPNSKVIARHKADALFPVVSAASIIAKVERDNVIEELNNEYNDEVGSGYPSDPKTRTFLENYYKTHHSFPNFVRTSWDTTKKLIEKNPPRKEKSKKCQTLEDYLN